MRTRYRLRYLVEGSELWVHPEATYGSIRNAEEARRQLQDLPWVRQIVLYEERIEAEWHVVDRVWVLR